MILDGSNVNLFVAFLGGLVTFFASCLLPLVPTYIAYLAGLSSKPSQEDKKEILVNSLLFTLGFSTVFILMGLTASSLGHFLRSHRDIIQRAGGIFLTFVGLFMFGFFESQLLQKERRINLHHEFIKRQKLKSFVFGLTFGFAWSPCIGPVLAVILFWASQAATRLKGMLLLGSYSLGLGVPFILIGMFYEKLVPKIKAGQKLSKTLNIVAALVITLTGVLLFLGKLEYFTGTLSRFFGFIPHGV